MRSSFPALLLLTILVLPLPMASLLSGLPSNEAVPDERHVPSEDPLFIRGPTVNMVTNHSALIFWRTDGLTDATVHFGLNESVMETADNTTLDTDHRIHLDSLSINSKYYYKVESNGTQSELYHFRTAPPDGGEFKMMILGDNQPSGDANIQPEEFKQFAQMVIAEEPHIIIRLGDYVHTVDENHETNLEAWASFNNISDSMGHYAPTYAVLGNHDTGAATGTRLLEYFFDAFEQYGEPSVYFSFDYAGVHFTFIDTEELGSEGRIVGNQLDWLMNDLESSSSKWKFVCGHRPMYPVVHQGDSLDRNPEERAALQALFEANNVTAYMNGHDHLYQRMTANGVVFLTSGGAGAPLYNSPWGGAFHHIVRAELDGNHVNMTVVGITGSVADTHQLPYDGPIEIFLRVLGNGTTKPVGSMPEVYFSQMPAERYYSWDSGANQTELTGIPGSNGLHTLDVYARDDEDVWSTARFVFTGVGATPTTTTPTGTGTGLDPLVLYGSLGIAGVVVVVVVVFWFRRRT